GIHPELQRSLLSIVGTLHSSGNHPQAHQFVQFVCGDFSPPTVLKFQLDAAIELLCLRRFVDRLEYAVPLHALEFQRRFYRKSHAKADIFDAGDLRSTQKLLNIGSLESLRRLRGVLSSR